MYAFKGKRTYSKLEHHKDFKQTQHGQDGCKQENHLGENEQLKHKHKKIKYKPAQNKKKNHRKIKYIKVYINWANDGYTTTYKDVDCWIRVLTLRLSLRP